MEDINRVTNNTFFFCLGIVVGQTTTAQVSVASASASASAGGLPASPTANTAQVSTLPNPVATPSSISNPVAKAGEPSITPSITSAEDFSATVNVTASPAANATAVQVPTGVMSTGGPSASPFTSSTESTNCSAVNTTACMPCSPGTFPNKGKSQRILFPVPVFSFFFFFYNTSNICHVYLGVGEGRD